MHICDIRSRSYELEPHTVFLIKFPNSFWNTLLRPQHMSRKKSRTQSITDRVIFVRMSGYVGLLALLIMMLREILVV